MASLSVSSRPRFEIKLHLRNTPREVLLRDLRRVAHLSGERSPTIAIYDRHGRVSAQALIHRFGSWNQALAAAQLPIGKPYNITQADLARAIRAAKQAGASEVEVHVGDTKIVIRLKQSTGADSPLAESMEIVL